MKYINLTKYKMKHLIAIDSDGTLRHSDGTITNETKSTISKLVRNGNVVVICTARPRYHGLRISDEVGLSDYLISSNGTEVLDIKNNNVIMSYYLPKYIIKKIYKDSKRNNLRVVFVCDNMEYVTKFTRNDSQVLLDDNNFEEVLSKKIKQIMVIGSEKKAILEYKSKIESIYKVVDSSNEFNNEIYFSIVNKKSSKGNAIKRLSKYLKISDIIAIGNDKNDLSMFEVANTSVCVNNACTMIKNKADIITESNDEDGVRKYLETLL